MRYGHIGNINLTHDLLSNKLFAAAFKWLEEHPRPAPTTEPQELIPGALSVRVIEFTAEPMENGTFESHYRNIDVHVFLGPGRECVFIEDTAELEKTEDFPTKDVALYATPKRTLGKEILSAGDFLTFTPTDAHMPQRIADNDDATGPKLKVVFKINAAALPPDLNI